MRLVSWNVNGLRACVGKGFEASFKALDADFFCLQETKMQAGQLDIQFDGYEAYWNYADKKGYSGTAIFTRHTPLSVTYGIGIALAGIAGCLLTGFYTIYPTAGASFGFRALIVVVVGGLGSIPGAFFAGIFLGLLETMVALFISPSYSDLIVFVTFIVILVVRQLIILRRK